MFTKNFFKYAMVQSFVNSLSANVLVDQTGASAPCSFTSNNQAVRLYYLVPSAPATASGACGVRIGTGTTPPTADDYKLENILTSGFESINQSATSFSVENDHVSASAVFGIKNTGTTALEINEIGLYGNISYNPVKCCLLERTVLEKPFTINPGETKQLTYTIRFNYPTE